LPGFNKKNPKRVQFNKKDKSSSVFKHLKIDHKMLPEKKEEAHVYKGER